MNILKYLFGKSNRKCKVRKVDTTKVVISECCIQSVRKQFESDIADRREAIAYFLGRTDGKSTIIVGSKSPKARKTYGSFDVHSLAMSEVIHTASLHGLQVVGQVHTHPQVAFHSEGDVEGAIVNFDGYVSIVVPDHGRHLPSLEGCAFYIKRKGIFKEIPRASIYTVPHWFNNEQS